MGFTRETGQSIQSAIHEGIALVAYQESWPSLFEAEKARLLDALPGRVLAIEHFGSTAIPGMRAKPIIDILAGVEGMAAADELFEPLLQIGYTTSRAFNDTLSDRRWFMRVSAGKRTHHLHVVAMNGRQWHERLLFRDALRARAELRQQYAELKHALARTHRNDREAYTNGKSDFIAAVVAKSGRLPAVGPERPALDAGQTTGA